MDGRCRVCKGVWKEWEGVEKDTGVDVFLKLEHWQHHLQIAEPRANEYRKQKT